MNVIIGREEGGDSRLRLNFDGTIRVIGEYGSVPKSVSREHCMLIITDDDGYSIENLNPNNQTFVDGREIVKKAVTMNSRILLGKDRFILDLKSVLMAISMFPYSISPLKEVYESYSYQRQQVKNRQRKLMVTLSVIGIFSMTAIACAFIESSSSWLRIALCIAAFLLFLCFFFVRHYSSNELLRLSDNIEHLFHQNYVCPNPKCKKFLGDRSFDELSKTSSCPNCKSKFSLK